MTGKQRNEYPCISRIGYRADVDGLLICDLTSTTGFDADGIIDVIDADGMNVRAVVGPTDGASGYIGVRVHCSKKAIERGWV